MATVIDPQTIKFTWNPNSSEDDASLHSLPVAESDETPRKWQHACSQLKYSKPVAAMQV